jgi:hypothetical protein
MVTLAVVLFAGSTTVTFELMVSLIVTFGEVILVVFKEGLVTLLVSFVVALVVVPFVVAFYVRLSAACYSSFSFYYCLI